MEPQIKKIGHNVLVKMAQNDQEVEEIMADLKDEIVITNGSIGVFDAFKSRLLTQTDIRKLFIDQMDADLLRVEYERVDNVSSCTAYPNNNH